MVRRLQDCFLQTRRAAGCRLGWGCAHRTQPQTHPGGCDLQGPVELWCYTLLYLPEHKAHIFPPGFPGHAAGKDSSSPGAVPRTLVLANPAGQVRPWLDGRLPWDDGFCSKVPPHLPDNSWLTLGAPVHKEAKCTDSSKRFPPGPVRSDAAYVGSALAKKYIQGKNQNTVTWGQHGTQPAQGTYRLLYQQK